MYLYNSVPSKGALPSRLFFSLFNFVKGSGWCWCPFAFGWLGRPSSGEKKAPHGVTPSRPAFWRTMVWLGLGPVPAVPGFTSKGPLQFSEHTVLQAATL